MPPGCLAARVQNVNGKLRLLYEAAPMSFLIEQAGGKAITGLHRIMDIVPSGVHQRCARCTARGAAPTVAAPPALAPPGLARDSSASRPAGVGPRARRALTSALAPRHAPSRHPSRPVTPRHAACR